MPEIGLDAASVVAVVGELEPACVPQHVGMNGKGEFRGHARPGDLLLSAPLFKIDRHDNVLSATADRRAGMVANRIIQLARFEPGHESRAMPPMPVKSARPPATAAAQRERRHAQTGRRPSRRGAHRAQRCRARSQACSDRPNAGLLAPERLAERGHRPPPMPSAPPVVGGAVPQASRSVAR